MSFPATAALQWQSPLQWSSRGTWVPDQADLKFNVSTLIAQGWGISIPHFGMFNVVDVNHFSTVTLWKWMEPLYLTWYGFLSHHYQFCFQISDYSNTANTAWKFKLYLFLKVAVSMYIFNISVAAVPLHFIPRVVIFWSCILTALPPLLFTWRKTCLQDQDLNWNQWSVLINKYA